MKKLLASSLLLSTLGFADSQMYVGVLGGYNSETFSAPTSKSSSSPVAKIQIGYGDLKGYSVQFGILYDKNNENIFATNGAKDKEKYALDVELVKAFDLNFGIYPFLKAGFGAGTFDTHIINGTDVKNSLNFSSYNAGAGLYYPLSVHFTLEAGATYKYISYEKADTASTQKAIDSNALYSYMGVNYRF